jgi:hypothetical protein
MIGRPFGSRMGVQIGRIVQIRDIYDDCAGLLAKVALIQFIIDDQVGMGVVKPCLVHELKIWINKTGNRCRGVLVADIGNANRVRL